MARDKRDEFLDERDRVEDIDDPAVRSALLAYADAMDREIAHVELPLVKHGAIEGHESKSNGTAKLYLGAVRCAYERGLHPLEADADTVNAFFDDLVTDPADRRHGIVDYAGSIARSTAKGHQAAFRQFFRLHTEPGHDRADVEVAWPADETADDGGIRIFSGDSTASVDHEDYPAEGDLDAMREACLESRNTRRDRAFVETVAGIGQRLYAVVTLRVGDVACHIDGSCDCPDGRRDIPHVLLNPDIEDDGDKGAIDNAGRWRPFLADTAPVRRWIDRHPLSDDELRAGVGAPGDFHDCYLFVGDISHQNTDPTSHWDADGARKMLRRRKGDTDTLPAVKTVERPVNPHAWRHLCYTRSQDIPGISERERRAMFGWAKGSDVGEKIYGHEKASKAAARFAEAWNDEFGDESGTAAAEQLLGDGVAGDVPPEARRALLDDLFDDDEALSRLSAELDRVDGA